MIGTIKCLYRDERGGGLVEVALVSLVLLVLLAGLVDVGRGFTSYITIVNAAREGARYGSRFPDEGTGIVDAVRQEAADSGVPPEAISVAIDGLGGSAGEAIQVTATYALATIIGDIIGSPSLTLRSATEMVIIGTGA